MNTQILMSIQLDLACNKKKVKKITRALLNKYQVVLIVTDHSKFNYKLISKEAKFIFDSRNVIKDRTKRYYKI